MTAATTPFLLTGQSTTSDVLIFQNLTELARKKTPLATRNLQTDYVLGRQGNLDGEYWNGDLAELLIFDRQLSDAERIAVSREMSDRYGLWTSETPTAPAPAELALASLCHVLLSSNEFVYVD